MAASVKSRPRASVDRGRSGPSPRVVDDVGSTSYAALTNVLPSQVWPRFVTPDLPRGGTLTRAEYDAWWADLQGAS